MRFSLTSAGTKRAGQARYRSGRDAGGLTSKAAVGSDGRSLRSRRRSAESTRTRSLGPARARHTPAPSRASRRSVRPGSTHRSGIGPTGSPPARALDRSRSARRSARRTSHAVDSDSRVSRGVGTASAGPNASPSSRTRSRDFSVRRRMLGRQNVPPVAGRSSSANRVSTKRSSSARVRSFRPVPGSGSPRRVRTQQANRARASSRTYQRSRHSGYGSRGSNRARSHQSAGRSTARRPARSYSSPRRSSPPAARSRNRGGGSRSRSYSGRARGSSSRGDYRARRNLGRR